MSGKGKDKGKDSDQPGEGFINFEEFDPAVASLIGQSTRRQIETRLPPDERKKKAQERQKAQARLEHRVNWDLPVWLKKRIIALAEAQRVPASQLAALFLIESLRRFEAGEIDLAAYKKPSHSPRYKANLELPEK